MADRRAAKPKEERESAPLVNLTFIGLAVQISEDCLESKVLFWLQ